MKVLMVEPGKVPYAAEIGEGLEPLQAAVGGDIQAVYPYDDPVALICNEEGKYMGLPLNRALHDDEGNIYDIVAGNFFLCGLGEEDFTDLPADLMEKYRQQFEHPEQFVRIAGKILAVKQPVPSPEEQEAQRAQMAAQEAQREEMRLDESTDLAFDLDGKVFLYMPKEKWIKKAMERGAIQVKRNNDTGKEMWRPMPRKDLMNRSDAEIVSTFNSEIRGLYNFYRIAENVGALHKYYYMVRYSMLKTLAGKHRTNVSVIKKRHMVNGVLRIPYDTTKGRKYCEFYHDGFRKHSDGYDNVADVMPSYRKYDSRHTIVNRIKAGVCEICGEHADYLCMHHVRTLKSLKGRDIFEQKMLKMRRKSLALCPDCFELLHETKESR